MKAACCYKYGPPDVVRIVDIPTPVPAPGEVLIRVHATTVTSADWRVRTLDLPPGFGPLGRLIFGFTGPRQPILGSELSGVIESVGSGVTRFSPGDRVIAFPDVSMGAHAEFRAMKADGMLAPMPPSMDFATGAALCFGGLTALHFLRKTRVQSGERVLVCGASGAVGSSVVQLARHLGATVAGVCSAANAEFVTALGAERVIDYRTRDFATMPERYDVIIDTTGTVSPARGRAALAPGGRLALVAAGLGDTLRAVLVGGGRLIAGPAAATREDMEHLIRLAESGHFRPPIEREFPLVEIAEAHRHVESGRKRGHVVVRAVHGQTSV